MTNGPAAVPRLVSINRQQLVLRSMDVEKLVDEEHCVRAIWELSGRLDLRRYYEEIAAIEGVAGREHTDPQLLIALWLYAYSRGVSSARELARQCEYEPGCQWLCGLQPVSHRTLSGFRSDNKAALDDLFTQVLGMLSAEGLITLETRSDAGCGLLRPVDYHRNSHRSYLQTPRYTIIVNSSCRMYSIIRKKSSRSAGDQRSCIYLRNI